MADTDTTKTSGKPTEGAGAEAAARTNSGANSPNTARAEAQAGDPYKPEDGTDYSLSINPEDTGEATVANLFQAVPLEYEGSGGALHDGEGLSGDGGLNGAAGGDGPRNGLGLQRNDNVPLPDGLQDVAETSDGGLGDVGGIGNGEVPEARGLDAGLSQFNLGGQGIPTSDDGIGDGIGGGGGGGGAGDGGTTILADDDGDDDGDDGGNDVGGDGGGGDDDPGSPIGPLTDINLDTNFVEENADPGTTVGVVAFAEDPDGDDVTYSIIGDSPFVIDPETGVISVGPGAVIDREETSSISVTVQATSSDGSSVVETFIIQIGDDNTEFEIGPVVDTDTTDNFILENSDPGTVVGVTAFAEDPDATDTVTYEIIGDTPFVIDPVTGVISVAPGAEIDRETTPFFDVTVQATSTDGSTSQETFRITVGDDNSEFPIGPVIDTDEDANFVQENAIGGTGIDVTAFAEDEDATDTVTYEIVGDSPFVIDPVTGVLTVKDGAVIDREETPFIDVTVQATSTDGSTSSQTFRVQVGDENEFEIGPVTDVDDETNFVEENSDGGTVVGVTAFAEDPDATDTVTYEIIGDSPFVIDPTTGVITVAPGADIDRETTPFIDVTVQATSTDGSTSQETFRVTVGDANEFGIGPVTDTDTEQNFVVENSDPGTVVGVTAFAEDPDTSDTVTYEIVGDSPFVIDPVSGLITVGPDAQIDREATPFIDVTVKATSTDGSTSQNTFRVKVGDENEGDIGPVVDTDKSNNDLNAVAENGTGGEEVGITAFAEDPDASDTVTYSTDDPRFDIDPDTGVLTVKPGVSFDYEQTKSVDVEITATSSDGSSSTGTFTVEILDVNEAPDLTFETGDVDGVSATITFTSEAAGYSNSFGVFVMDANGDPVAGQIVWTNGNELTPGETATVSFPNVDAANIGYFLIPDGADKNPGIAAGDMVTFQKDGDGNWQAVAQDGTPLTGQDANVYFSGDASLNPDGVDHTVESGVTIGFEDLVNNGDEDFDDFVFQTQTTDFEYRTTIVEEVEGAEAAPLSVIDPDEGDTHTFTVSDERFEVVVAGDKYVLKLKDDQALDYETETQVSVTVTATDSGGLSDTETIIIDVIDVDESKEPIGPLSDSDNSDNLVAENSDAGTVVGVTAFATDPDTVDTVTYEIVDQTSPFVIDPTSGVISVAPGADIDRETTPSIDVTVKATSTDGTSTTKTFTVEVGDEDEFDIGPVTDVDTSDNTISETADGGEDTGITAFAEDEDATDTVTYELTGGGDRFEINETTGVIKVKDGAQFDAEIEPTVDVTVKATSTDGSSSSKTFSIDVTDGNEPPDLIVEYGDIGTNLIKNGSFESFDVATGKWSQFSEDSSGAWTSNGKMEVWDNFGGIKATEGEQHLELDSEKNVNSISQTVETSVGQVYDLSFDVQARRDDASNTVEIYWNGELVSTVDPAFGYWETVEFQVVGTGGNDVLEFRETSEDNNTYGAFIDNVELTGTNRIGVYEELEGAKVVPLSVIDPDVGDTHTFTVSDDRFEVVAADGKYLLKLKDDQALDYETEQQVTVQITATDTGGLSDTETVVIDVIDIDEGAEPIGPLSDSDNSDNLVAENSDAGTVVGVTAFATDPDTVDTVTYEIVDQTSPFVIDPTSGVISVAPGADIDRETTPSIDVTVKATSTDGTSTTKTFTVEVGDEDEFDIGPVTDVDTSDNIISETADGGEDTGITAFAEDEDATDTVTYELTGGGDRFEINETTGVIKVKDGAQFDAETEPTVDVTVKATSTDGSSSSKTFSIDVTDGNEPPDLIVELENASNELVINGGFENFSGTLSGTDGTGWYDTPDTIEGWTYNDVDIHQSARHGEGTTDGAHRLDLTADDNGTISQTIEGQLDGHVYTLSFNMNSRGNKSGEGVAEVYWNGELIDTIDPTDGGGGWQSYSYDIVGGSGDGTNTLTFVEKGSDNSHGTYIDTVSIKADGRIAILEEFKGAEVAPLSVIDPDVGDTHTFTVSDDRFEVVAADGKYLLKLKDDQALDYETEQQVTVQVTATDSGGLSDTETVIVDVIDIDENEGDIGPVVDTDKSNNDLNAVAENGTGGEEVGITAFAEDPDASDTVTYSTDDPRFDIDPDTGVLTVKPGVSFDYEQTKSVDVEITATSSDGSSSTGTFTVEILDVNEAPDLTFETGDVDGVSATITFTSEAAGYSNSFGVFVMDANGDPVAGQIVWTNGNELTPGETATVSFPNVDAANIGYFLIPDGADKNPGIAAGDMVTFQKDGDGNWQAVAQDGTPLTGQDANVYFSGDASLNPDGVDHTVESGVTIGFEDLVNNGDEDFDDFVFQTQTTDFEYRTTIVEEVEGAEAAPLSVIDPDEGDTHTFTVSDERFEVVVAGDKYVLKLKDDQALDYETETQVSVTVTATDSGGLSDTETIIIDVIDVDESKEPIGPLSDSDNSDNLVAENSDAGTVVGVTAFATDPDTVDTVTYEIVDQTSPFVIDPTSGVISVAPGADIDRETTPSIDVTVKATSTDGTSTTKTFTVEVGDEDEFDIGPVTDVDTSDNTISETADGGEDTGITAFAEDEDATDTVTYELTGGGDRFEINETTGVIKVKDGAQFDAEIEPTVDVTVKATSTDGSSSSKTFSIDVTDGNEPPDLIVELETGSKQFIVNGSFEDFDGQLGGSDGSGWYQDPNSIDGWSYDNVDVHQAGHNNFGATDGNHHLDLASVTNGWASQQIEGQMEGQVYELQFDMKSRGGVGQSVAEVYWNGELIDTIDPATTGTGWQTYNYNIVGGSGDGSNTLTFVEIGSDNNGGALIDSVSIVSDNRTAVVEEFFGAEIAPLSVIDPDIGDTHTFTVSDDRFEVVVAGDKYVLKLKDNQALDYETETQVTLEVTATDQGGLSDTEVVVIDVIDIDETNTPLTDLIDSDTSDNVIAEGATAGTVVGLTAFANEPDVGDSVTYAITDARFEIDPDTGVVTVADNASFDAEQTPFIDLDVTATSTDGSSVTETFRIDVTEFDEPPVANDDAATVGLTKTSFYYSDDDGEIHLISSDGSDVVIGSTGVGAMTDIALDNSGNLYGITFNKLYSVDPDTGEASLISTSRFGTSMNALEFGPDGTLYAADTSGKLYSVDVNDGSLTKIGQMEYGSAGDLAFSGDKLYLSASNGKIVEIDPDTGATIDVVATLPVSNAFGLVGDEGGQLYAFTNGGRVYQIDPETGTVSIPDAYVMNDSGWGATETADSSGQTAKVEGNVLTNDTDAEGALTVTNVSFDGQDYAPGSTIQGDYGSLLINSDGTYTYILDPDSPAAQALGQGDFDVEVFTYTVTDSAGNTDTANLKITVNGDDYGPAVPNTDIGPVQDADSSKNLIAASVAAGALVGLTALAEDVDAADTVTYTIDDSRFDIDEDTGVVTVADGATLTPGETIDVVITATSSDGSQSSATFPIEVTDGDGGGNTAPDLIVGDAVYKGKGGHTDDHHDDHHGHIKDGPKGSHDHDDDDEDGKPHGHTDDDGIYVAENSSGAGVVALSVVDPDADDTHTFTVSDDRFEVVSDGSGYMLKLKDGVSLDFEEEQSITLDVTATDSGGLSDTETITLDVIDVDDSSDDTPLVSQADDDDDRDDDDDYGDDDNYELAASSVSSTSNDEDGNDDDESDDEDSNVIELPTFQVGTEDDDELIGEGANDALFGKGGDDTLSGEGGNDALFGGPGDDALDGGSGDDSMNGGDGSDVFAYMLGDGNDSIYGGAGENWIDIIDLGDGADGTQIGEYGTDWSVTVTDGSIENVDPLNGEVSLSQDSGGHIDLADGGRVDFAEIEGIQYS